MYNRGHNLRVVLLSLLLIVVPAEAQETLGGAFVDFGMLGICVGESDGSPDASLNCGITTLKFDGATVTNNNDGSATITIVAAANEFWLQEDGTSFWLQEDGTSKWVQE